MPCGGGSEYFSGKGRRKMNGESRQRLQKTSTGKSLAKSAVFVVLMILAAYIKIPFFPVPLTFQTVVAVLAGLLLGPKYGTASIGVYVIMGLLGLPVFTGGGGIVYVVQVTFGYLIGFIFAAFVAGIFRGQGELKISRAIFAAIAGFFVNYLIGIPYFIMIWKYYLSNGGLWEAVLTYNILYMPKDLVLSVLAAIIAQRVNKVCLRD